MEKSKTNKKTNYLISQFSSLYLSLLRCKTFRLHKKIYKFFNFLKNVIKFV